eukprot:scaffold150268_cov37-Tisochrysis_lutea.AAC.1
MDQIACKALVCSFIGIKPEGARELSTTILLHHFSSRSRITILRASPSVIARKYRIPQILLRCKPLA